jgi:hypothetical protein
MKDLPPQGQSEDRTLGQDAAPSSHISPDHGVRPAQPWQGRPN